MYVHASFVSMRDSRTPTLDYGCASVNFDSAARVRLPEHQATASMTDETLRDTTATITVEELFC